MRGLLSIVGLAFVACRGGGKAAPVSATPPVGEPVPIRGLERVHLGDSMDTVMDALPGAHTVGDAELSFDGPIEGLPATTSVYFDADGVSAVSAYFGELCGNDEDSRPLYDAMKARFGPVTIERYVPTWWHGSWVIEVECHSADTMGWLGLVARKR